MTKIRDKLDQLQKENNQLQLEHIKQQETLKNNNKNYENVLEKKNQNL